MKKILTVLLAAVLAAGSMSAKEYQHSLGMVAGLGIGAQYKTMVMPNFTIIEEFGYTVCPTQTAGAGGYDGMLDNLVLAYQATCAEGQGIRLDWYAGGQIKLGYGIGSYGIFGIGGAAGIEAIMTNAPIAFSFVFRPGYGCLFASGGAGHTFDYTLNLGVRYTF